MPSVWGNFPREYATEKPYEETQFTNVKELREEDIALLI